MHIPDEKDEEASGITDKGLLIKTLCVLTVVIVLFLSGSIPGFKLTLGKKLLCTAIQSINSNCNTVASEAYVKASVKLVEVHVVP